MKVEPQAITPHSTVPTNTLFKGQLPALNPFPVIVNTVKPEADRAAGATEATARVCTVSVGALAA